MAYFEPSIDAEGVHIPTYNDIMEYLIGQYKQIFGDDVYIKEDTKDYQLLSVFARCMDDYAALVIDSYNARNPNYATGDSLDLLLPLISMKRLEATPSTVTLKLTGSPGTDIPEGSQAIDIKGNIWNLDSAVTLDENGEATVTATCDIDGAIDAPIGNINEIYTPVIGWEEVTNEEEAIVGRNVETDDALRLRRKQSVNLENNGTYDALMRGLLNLDIDGEVPEFVKVLVNDTGSTDANGIPGHSICCLIKGLDDYEDKIAETIWKAKAPGIGTYGGPEGDGRRAITYVDSGGNSNVINFARPEDVEVDVEITINALNGYDEERVLPMITEAVVNEINSLEIGKTWGVTTAYRDIYNAFSNETCPFVVASITGQTDYMGSASAVEVDCDFNQKLICDASHVTITVNE